MKPENLLFLPSLTSLSADPFREGLAAVANDGKWGFIDSTGKFAISPQFEWVSFYSDGLAAAKSGGKVGYIDKSGKFAITPQFDMALDFREGLAQVGIGNINDSSNSRQGYINKEGKYVWNPAN